MYYVFVHHCTFLRGEVSKYFWHYLKKKRFFKILLKLKQSIGFDFTCRIFLPEVLSSINKHMNACHMFGKMLENLNPPESLLHNF